MSQRLVPIGEIVATHGTEGWLKLKPYNPKSTTLSLTQNIFLEKGGVCTPQRLGATRPHRGQFLLQLKGIDDLEAAKKSVGSILSVAEEQLQPLSPCEYYYYQVIGLDVFGIEGNWVGILTRIWSKPGGDLYVVTGTSKEYLIPAVKEIIEKVDLPNGRVIINPPEGLLDL